MRNNAFHRRDLTLGTLELPAKIDPDNVEANIEDGVLEVTLLKPQAAKVSVLAKAASA